MAVSRLSDVELFPDTLVPRVCRWCRAAIAVAARPDAVHCSQRCRQAAHRFYRQAIARARAEEPMRFAYGDPPYPGKARAYYSDHPDFAGEVDHTRLVEQLVTEFPDGWALSTSSEALPAVLSLCVAAGVRVRVAAWVRRWRFHADARWPLSAWEPVVYAGGRPSLPAVDDTSAAHRGDASCEYSDDAAAAARLDALVCLSGPRLTDPDRVIGAKPAEFCWWLFDLLGARPGDELVDLFPGSGGISRAWAHFATLEERPAPARIRSTVVAHDVPLPLEEDAWH